MYTFLGSACRRAAQGLFVAGLLFTVNTAGASVVFQQGPVNGGVAYYSNINQPQQLSDDFSLGGAASLTRISWWGVYDGNNQGSDEFLLRLHGALGTGVNPLYEFSFTSFTRTSTALNDTGGNSAYKYELILPAPLSLAAGTYYLSIQNQGDSDWAWLESEPGTGNAWFRAEDSDQWSQFVGNLAFRVEDSGNSGTVDEPGTLALLGLGGLGMLLGARRRKQSITSE